MNEGGRVRLTNFSSLPTRGRLRVRTPVAQLAVEAVDQTRPPRHPPVDEVRSYLTEMRPFMEIQPADFVSLVKRRNPGRVALLHDPLARVRHLRSNRRSANIERAWFAQVAGAPT